MTENEIEDFDLGIPMGNVFVSKNCPTVGSSSIGESCITITIANPESVESFISSLNQINYRTSHDILDIWGYKYIIEFDNTVIYVVTDQYFYFNDVLYEPTFGDFRFLDELGW